MSGVSGVCYICCAITVAVEGSEKIGWRIIHESHGCVWIIIKIWGDESWRPIRSSAFFMKG